jgi:hypothetical protein
MISAELMPSQLGLRRFSKMHLSDWLKFAECMSGRAWDKQLPLGISANIRFWSWKDGSDVRYASPSLEGIADNHSIRQSLSLL